MNLWQTLARNPERAAPLTLDEYANWFSLNGLAYGLTGSTTISNPREEIGGDFKGFIDGAYKSNGVIFSCVLARMLVFSEARFQFRQMRSGRPGDLFGNPSLQLLERPWPNATTGDLLTRGIQDADLAGNFYAVRRPRGIKRMRPDWVTIITGTDTRPDQDATPNDLDLEVLGYAYHPGGKQSGNTPVILMREEVAHFAPIPDPSANFRGMSWISPIVREVMADTAATSHKLQFFENGATPNMVVTLDPAVNQAAAEKLQAAISAKYAGLHGAYETMVLGGGADVKVIGADMRQVDFKVTQGHGETRVAAAAGVPPIIVGLSEGLQSATYSNYGQAKRRFADGTIRPLWRNMAGSLSTLVDVPAGAELWYDDRDIPFLAEDVKDAAEAQQVEASTISTLVDAGYEPDAVIDAVTAGDLKRLKGKHTGLYSVQLQAPTATPPAGSQNGNGQPALPAATT